MRFPARSSCPTSAETLRGDGNERGWPLMVRAIKVRQASVKTRMLADAGGVPLPLLSRLGDALDGAIGPGFEPGTANALRCAARAGKCPRQCGARRAGRAPRGLVVMAQ